MVARSKKSTGCLQWVNQSKQKDKANNAMFATIATYDGENREMFEESD